MTDETDTYERTLAERVRANHKQVGIRCRQCLETWPCDASRIVNILLLDVAKIRALTTLIRSAASVKREDEQ